MAVDPKLDAPMGLDAKMGLNAPMISPVSAGSVISGLSLVTIGLISALWYSLVTQINGLEANIGELRGKIESMSDIINRNAEHVSHLTSDLAESRANIEKMNERLESFRNQVNDRLQALRK